MFVLDISCSTVTTVVSFIIEEVYPNTAIKSTMAQTAVLSRLMMFLQNHFA